MENILSPEAKAFQLNSNEEINGSLIHVFVDETGDAFIVYTQNMGIYYIDDVGTIDIEEGSIDYKSDKSVDEFFDLANIISDIVWYFRMKRVQD